MEVKNCRLLIHKGGSDVPKRDVTPAEAQLLILIHQLGVGKMPLTDFEAKPRSIKRTQREELNRLRAFYSARNEKDEKLVDVCFPGINPKLPTTFDEADLAGFSAALSGAEPPDTETFDDDDEDADFKSSTNKPETSKPLPSKTQ